MITAGFFGALGNQMFQYALVRTVAEQRGYNFYVPAQKWFNKGVFDLEWGIDDGGWKMIFKDTLDQKFNPAVFNVSDFTLFYGFFQSERYFDHAKARTWFKPLETPLISDNICIVHFRGLDYFKEFNAVRLPLLYYNEAKELVKSTCHDVRFVVVTDDFESACKLFPGDEVLSESVARDFATLYYAKYVIISNSSFAWWGAWLNPNNFVVAPQGWFNYNTDKIFQPSDIKVERFNWI